MKRWYIAAVAGLCAVGPVSAQQGALAPTAPVVPAPVLQNGGAVKPAGGLGAVARPFAGNNWSPVRSPVVPSDLGYTGHPPAPPALAAPCGPTGCDTGRARGSCLERIKSWLCFQYSPTELPKMRPTPYVTPIQGLFSCSSGAGCAPCGPGGCAPAGYSVAAPAGQPLPAPAPLQMPAPMKPPAGAGAVLMPPRAPAGAPAQTTWQTPTEFGTVKGSANPVVNTGYRVPQK